MKKRLTPQQLRCIALYFAGPAVVLIVMAFAISPALLAPASIPITSPVDHTAANLTGLAASLVGALVLGVSIWWFSRLPSPPGG